MFQLLDEAGNPRSCRQYDPWIFRESLVIDEYFGRNREFSFCPISEFLGRFVALRGEEIAEKVQVLVILNAVAYQLEAD